MKVTKQQLVNLNNILRQVQSLPGVKFAYAVNKNLKKLSEEIEAIAAAERPSEEFIEHQQKLQELAMKHAERDDDGNVVTAHNERGEAGIVVPPDDELFIKARKALDKKYAKAIKEQEKKSAEVMKILAEEIEIDDFNLHKVKLKDLPNNLNGLQLEILDPMIDD